VVDPRLEKVRPKEVRLISADGKMIGIFSLDEAIKFGEKEGLDLILVNEKQSPVVVRLGNYKQFIYERKKKEKEKKKKKSEVKEIRISFTEAQHDLERKAKIIEEFLEEGHQVRIRMMMKGRERLFQNLAREKIENFLNLINLPYNIIQPIEQKGSILTILIAKKH